MVTTCCYLDKESYNILNFKVNNSSYFKISAPFNKRRPLKLWNWMSAGDTY